MARRDTIRNIGIIGSGPSGATLASLLTMKGVDVTLFDDGRRPDLIVGESLIPAILPVLEKLGLQERAASGRRCGQKSNASMEMGYNWRRKPWSTRPG
jgi:2-polyprenyl-6-methoxyphenol hydroxylase-like FAD-dependent oxidoreductase